MATAKNFYIGSTKIEIEISPQLASTLDETLDNLNVTTIANDIANPYLPFQKFYIKDENNNVIQTFIISSDNVELATENPLRYKHHLSLVQESEFLTKHEIRNTVFSTSIYGHEHQEFIGATAFSSAPATTSEPIIWGQQYKTKQRDFGYLSSNTSVSIDLSQISIKSATMSIRFLAQFTSSAYYLTTFTPYRFYTYGQDKNIKKWSEIYKPVGTEDTEGAYLPTIKFQIGNQTRTWQISSEQGVNESTLQVPNSIINWIKGFSSGTLIISIVAAPNNNTFLYNDTFADKILMDYRIPMFVSISYNFNFVEVSQSVYSVIETLLKQQMKETVLYNSTGFPNQIKELFKLPTASHNADLYNLLNETNAPNFVFTQCTMYDALAEIFKLFDAIFTIDNDGYLDIEYFNNRGQSLLKNDLTVAGKGTSLSEERFTNKLITYFQNTKMNDRFPNSNETNATAYIRSKTLGVPGESDYVFIVPKPISQVLSVMIKPTFTNFSYINDNYRYYFSGFTSLLDITKNVIEESLWSLLNPTSSLPIDSDWSKVGKYNALSYKRGTNYIDISGYYNTTYSIKQTILDNVIRSGLARLLGIKQSQGWFPTPSQAFTDVQLAVKYIALVDGKLVNESLDNKYNGESLINQSNGSIDINKLGLNMVGLSLKMGQPTLNMTQIFSSWDNRVKKGQYFVDSNGDRWVANNCVYTIIKPDLIQTNIEFVKNFNGLAKRIELNSEKRLSNISNELTVKCEETYGEFIYYSTEPFSSALKEQIHFSSYYLANQIAMGFGTTLPDELHGTIALTQYIEYTSISNIVNQSLTNPPTSEFKRVYSAIGYYKVDEILDENNDPVAYIPRLYENDDFSGSYIDIPLHGCHANALVFSEISETFSYNADSDYDDTFEEGDEIRFYFLIDENYTLVFGAFTPLVSQDDEFNPNAVPKVIESNNYTVEYALLTAWHEPSANPIQNDSLGAIKNIAIPMVVYGSGNSVCFEMSYDSPISAGTQLRDNSPLWSGGWFSNAVLYTDTDGTADSFTIDFVKLQEPLTRRFPEMKSANNTYLKTYLFGKINRLKYYKKPNEIFALNYQLHFLPKNKNVDFLSNEWIKNNAFANGQNTRAFSVIWSTQTGEDYQYSILDTKGIGLISAVIDSISHEVNVNQNALSYKIIFKASTLLSSTWRSIKSWAIVDEENNIYFASNSSPSNDNSLEEKEFAIYFISRHFRLS